MTDGAPEVESLVVRSVTVSEVMGPDGELDIVIQTDGEPELWTVLGMLECGLISVRADLTAIWAPAEDE